MQHDLPALLNAAVESECARCADERASIEAREIAAADRLIRRLRTNAAYYRDTGRPHLALRDERKADWWEQRNEERRQDNGFEDHASQRPDQGRAA